MKMLLLTHAFSTCFMVGLIWFVQIVHYPMFRDVGEANFRDYEIKHSRLTTWVVGPVMLVEIATSALILMKAVDSVDKRLALIGAVLIGIVWLSTALLQVPMHQKLESGFLPDAWHRLVWTNWIRTIAWSARGVVALAMLSVRMAD